MVTKHQEKQIVRKLEKGERAWSKFKLGIFILVLIWIFSTSLYAGWSVMGYINTHTFKWQLPFVLRTPLVIDDKKPLKMPVIQPLRHIEKKKVEVPLSDEKAIAMSQKHGSVLWNIFQLESQRGKNDECRRLGLGYNGLGLGESDEYIRLHGPNCFPTLEALWTRAERLIVDLGVDHNEAKGVCRWKYGDKFNEPSCAYYQHYLSL